jgi:hypothetical protein
MKDIPYRRKRKIKNKTYFYIPEFVHDNLINDLKILIRNWGHEAKYWDVRADLCVKRGPAGRSFRNLSAAYKKCVQQLKNKL